MNQLPVFDFIELKLFDQETDLNYMKCFNKLEKSALLGSSVMSPSNIKTAEDCVEECAKAEDRYDQICKSVLWYKDSKECVLNDKTRNDTDAVFVQDPELSGSIDYYEKICEVTEEEEDEKEKPISGSSSNASPPSISPNANNKPAKKRKKSKEIAGIRSCFSKFKHSSLVGYVDRIHDNVTERECLTKCWKCEECLTKDREPCKSVIYYESVKQCILTKESRRTQTEYFDQTESLATFFERRKDCLFEMCEDQEIDLVFAVDGSEKMNWYGFDKSIKLIDSIVTKIHETTEFWKITVIQVGTEGPSVVEIPRKSFDTLDEFRRSLATIGWRRSSGNRLGDSLVDVADMAMRYADSGETDFVWMITLTPGFSSDSLNDFETLKKQNYFTSFAVGVGSDLDFDNLQKIASTSSYLIHSQDTKTIIKEISSKLCPKDYGIDNTVTTSENTVTPTVHNNNDNGNKNLKLPDEFVSKTDAYKTSPWKLRDDIATKQLVNNGIKTKIIPSTIAFLGQPRNKNAEKFQKFLSSGKKLKKLASEFVKSIRNDTVFYNDEDGKIIEKYWIGFKRSELGLLEWSDGSNLMEFDKEKSKHLEIHLDNGECAYWGSNMEWQQEDCYKKMPFVCNMKPVQTINQKLETDFGTNSFENSFNRENFAANLEPFMPISPTENTEKEHLETSTHLSTVPTTIRTIPAFFNWGPNSKYTPKTGVNPPSATPPMNTSDDDDDNDDNEENTSKILNPKKLNEITAQISNILIPLKG